MNFCGTGQPLARAGLNKALAILELSPNDAAYIWTVIEVETAGLTQGFGFRVDRRPQILFERHIFRKYTNGRLDNVAPDISGPPGGYGLLSEQYTKLEKALSLCAEAKLGAEPALKSTSWGMGQVMGFNCALGGYKSCKKMVQAMVRSEDAQLACMAGFLKANGLAEKLIKRDWAGFAKIYNGPSYWQNRYDVKLTEQYQRLPAARYPILKYAVHRLLCFSWVTLREKSTASSAPARVQRSRTFGSPPVWRPAKNSTARPIKSCAREQAFTRRPSHRFPGAEPFASSIHTDEHALREYFPRLSPP